MKNRHLTTNLAQLIVPPAPTALTGLTQGKKSLNIHPQLYSSPPDHSLAQHHTNPHFSQQGHQRTAAKCPHGVTW